MVNAGRQRFILVRHAGKSWRPTSSVVWIVYCALRYLLCLCSGIVSLDLGTPALLYIVQERRES